MLFPFFPNTADTRRALEADYQLLTRRLDQCQRLASGLWNRANEHRAAGKDAAQMEQLAREVEDACHHLRAMIHATEQQAAAL